MVSGMARSHRGCAGTVPLVSAWVAGVALGRGAGGFERTSLAGTSTGRALRLWPAWPSVRPARRSGPARSVSGPSGGLRPDAGESLPAATSAASTVCAARVPEERGEFVDVGRQTSRPVPRRRVPEANRWRSGDLKVPAGSATRPTGVDPPTETGSLGWRSSGRPARRGSMSQRDRAAVAYARDGRLYAMGGFPYLMNKSLTASLMSS